MKLRPLHDWALVRRIASAEKTSGGIIIPEAAKEKPGEGVVEAIGPGRYKKEPGKKGRYIPTVLKPGQRVYFADYMAKEVEIDGKEFTFIREEDVLGLVEETGALEVKKEHPVAEKKDHPVMVQAGPKTAPKKAVAEKEKPAVKKPAPKKAKPGAKNSTAAKKPAKAKKAAPAKKTEKKTVSKTTAAKKAKSPVKKTAAKKPAAKKAATAKKAPKKVAVKKTVAKKPVKKTAAKTKKKTRK